MMIEFHHGALCDKYEDQVRAQGFTYGADADYIQQIGDNIIWLWVQDIFTDSVYDKALQRFQKKYLTNRKYLKKLEVEG